ncbi:MAG TPA: transketolase [Desulfobacteraceae bacterium]|nr:transketolase [Desulfobacteraceae bacterium]
MRNAFAREIEAIAEENNRVVLLSGDIGNRLFNPYKEKFPDRFYNCGVSEANMASMAAGMAMNGLHPITYTITPFNTSRCYEQIKIDICYHNLPVIVVGVGAGLSYAGLGATHHSFEDIAIMRVLPNMHIMCPADAVEVGLCLREAVRLGKPAYIRLGKKNEPVVHDTPPDLTLGEGVVLKQGDKVCILSCGNITPVALDAAAQLDKRGIDTEVVSMHTVKPLDDALLKERFRRFQLICTVEEHSLIGGFGAAVAEWMVDYSTRNPKLLRFGINDAFVHKSGTQENARQMTGLTAEHIACSIEKTYTQG